MITAGTRNAPEVQPSRFALLGVPVGDFGFFASLLISFSLGFMAFFAATFVAIVALLLYNQGAHHNVNYADSYRYIGLSAGLAVLTLALSFFGVLWVRRKVSGR